MIFYDKCYGQQERVMSLRIMGDLCFERPLDNSAFKVEPESSIGMKLAVVHKEPLRKRDPR